MGRLVSFAGFGLSGFRVRVWGSRFSRVSGFRVSGFGAAGVQFVFQGSATCRA